MTRPLPAWRDCTWGGALLHALEVLGTASAVTLAAGALLWLRADGPLNAKRPVDMAFTPVSPPYPDPCPLAARPHASAEPAS